MPPSCTGLDPAEPLQGLLFFGTGLAVSLGHCLGMCGPIVSGFALAQRAGGARGLRLARALTLYHAGRLTSYTTLGTLAGLVGSGAALVTARGAVSLAAGAAMGAVALGLLGVLPTRAWVERSALARPVMRWLRTLLAARRPSGHLGLGLANGLLPCGPVTAVAIGAAAAGPLRGGLSLLLFGLGTVPVLALAGLSAASLPVGLRQRFDRAAALLVSVLALQLLLRGLASFGAVPHAALGRIVLW